ncbi:MAG: AMP-binding protein, partial [Burkholderiaceae bacterium]|nr:AMP-binding protein [Burkholderiaceae bacterium]
MDDEATGRFMPAGAHDTVFACFARQAQADPLAVAVIDERGHTTYGELAARADALARHLRASGCEPGQPVGVLMER